MTRILALDTSSWWGSVALVEHGAQDEPRIVAAYGEHVADSHAERLLPWIERLLADAGWSKSDPDAFAAAHGPGSFTGIRVGLGTIRGLALATGRPCVGVTSLAAVALAHGAADRPRVPVMQAGRGEWYAAAYDAASDPPVEQREPWVAPAASVAEQAAAAGGMLIPGPGTRLDEGTTGRGGLAGAVGCIAARRLRSDRPLPPLAPLYVRPPDALAKRARR